MSRTFELPIDIWTDLQRKADDDCLTLEDAAIIALHHCRVEHGYIGWGPGKGARPQYVNVSNDD